jgi:arylsulfatase A-like enzyme
MQHGVVLAWTPWGLPLEERTLAEGLRDAGYRTALVGKWHLGSHQRAYLPLARGFDSHYGSYLGFTDYFTRLHLGGLDWHRDEEPVREEGYVTDLLAEEAVRVVEQHDASRPLFLFVSFTAPHEPLQAPVHCLARAPAHEWPAREVFAAMVTCMDDAIGRILSAYRKRGWLAKTLVFFASDNGASDLTFVLGGSNLPLRGGKGGFLEGGIRVPALLSWPGRLPAGSTYPYPLHAVDVFATLAARGGADTGSHLPIDGRDAWSAIRNGRSHRREIVHNVFPDGTGVIRRGRWKLMLTAERAQLFDLEQDPHETHDLAGLRPRKVEDLRRHLAAASLEALPTRVLPLFPPPGFQAPEVWDPED